MIRAACTAIKHEQVKAIAHLFNQFNHVLQHKWPTFSLTLDEVWTVMQKSSGQGYNLAVIE